MTIPGIDMVVALGIQAATGEVGRFARPQHLVSYLGLNPSVRQLGPGPAYHGRITKQGRGHARGIPVEAAWAAARALGPLRAFFLRISAGRGRHVAAVTTARKLAVIVWHLLRRQEDYAWVRPALHARKIRDLELRAGHPARRGQRGSAYAYNLTTVLQRERRRVEQAEKAYEHLVRGWNPRGPRARTGRCQGGATMSCAVGLAPRALLFATQSPMRRLTIARPTNARGSAKCANSLHQMT
jgi:transposase